MPIGFWLFMTVMNILVPLMMIGFGSRFINHPPEKINMVYGYRTSMSMINQQTWDYAHALCGKIWYYCGIVMLVITIVVMAFLYKKEETVVETVGTILCIIEIFPLLISIIPVEIALRKRFNKNGNRKE